MLQVLVVTMHICKKQLNPRVRAESSYSNFTMPVACETNEKGNNYRFTINETVQCSPRYRVGQATAFVAKTQATMMLVMANEDLVINSSRQATQ